MPKEDFDFVLFGLRFTGSKKSLVRLTLQVWLVMALILLFSVLLFGYEMTGADIPGGIISGILVAYLIHLFQE